MATDSIYGTLDMLILRTLAAAPAHGLAVKQKIEGITSGALSVEPGALYPALHRLQKKKLISARWGTSPKGRRAKVYSVTKAGEGKLATELEKWDRHVQAIGAVLERMEDVPA